MNKKVILILLSAVMLSTWSHAQKVIKNGASVIIDCSEMDPKFYVSIPKPRRNLGGSDLDTNLSLEKNDEKVYKKFQVNIVDNSNGETKANAIELCANFSALGGLWRLATDREMKLIWILHAKLVANGMSPFQPMGYWSASSTPPLNMSTGLSSSYIDVEKLLPVRCIRDL